MQKVSRFSRAKWHRSRAKQRQRNVQKSVMHVHLFFWLIRSTDFVAVKHYMISFFLYKYLVNESFAFSPG